MDRRIKSFYKIEGQGYSKWFTNKKDAIKAFNKRCSTWQNMNRLYEINVDYNSHKLLRSN